MSFKKSLFFIALTVSLCVSCVSCDQAPAGRGAGEVATSSQANTSFKVEKVAGGLQVPGSIVWAPNGRMIFAERPGRVRVIETERCDRNRCLSCLTLNRQARVD